MVRNHRRTLVLVLILLLGATDATAAEFLRRQAGTTTLPGASTTVALGTAIDDLSKAILFFSTTIDNNATGNILVGGEITNATTLTFERNSTTGTVSISWEVVEFESGVFVQRGSNVVAESTNVDVTISCTDLDKSFVIVTGTNGGSTLGSDDGATGDLTSATNLRLLSGDATGDFDEAFWQVVEYQGATVQKLNNSLTGASLVATIPTAVDMSKTMIISNHLIDENFEASDLPRTELTATDEVTYTRNTGAGTCDFVTYVVEFTDLTSVARGTQSFASGITSETVTGLTTATSSCVIAPGNFGRQGSTDFTTDDNPGHNWFTYELTSSTTLDIDRAVGTGSTAEAPWQIVTFQNLDDGLQSNTFYSIGSGDWETSANWSYTSDGSGGAVPDGVYPRRTNNVVIQSGHSIAIDAVTDNNPCSASADDLGLANVGPFTGSDDQMFYHTGDIIIADGGTLTTSEEVMLGGYTLVEDNGSFTATEDIINLGLLEISALATFGSTLDDLILSGNSYTIIDNTSTTADDIYIDHTDAILCGDGGVEIGNGGPDPVINWFNPDMVSRLDQICGGFDITCNSNCTGASTGTGTGGFSDGNTGLGGVGDAASLQVWLRADDLSLSDGSAVTSWSDVSGNSLTATATGAAGTEPTFDANTVNSTLPSLSFDETEGDFLNLGQPTGLDYLPGTDSWSFFMVYQITNVAEQGTFFSKADATGGNRTYQYTVDDSGAAPTFFSSNIGGNLQAGTVQINTGAWFVSSHTNDATARDSWTNETANIVNDAIGTNNTGAVDVLIGARRASGNTGTGFLLDGSIAELAMYTGEVTLAQRIIITNYLAAKYDITLSANDVYSEDDNGYDFEVAGIGQASDGTNHIDAVGLGVLRMWNADDLDNGEFLMWGHENTAINTTGQTAGVDVDGTVIQQRLSRIWGVSEVGDVGNVSISFDFSGVGGNPLGSNLRLLIDRDSDGFADNDVDPIVGTVSDGVAVFSNVDLNDGDLITLGNTTLSSPLPIELLEFSVFQEANQVVAQWTTASELNNDFYTLERSLDGNIWQMIGSLPGSGTTNLKKRYTTFDEQPPIGVVYYRLKQTDFDGQYTYSPIRLLNLKSREKVSLFPNPSTGIFTISGISRQHASVTLFNVLGKKIMFEYMEGDDLQINIQSHPPGIYLLRIVQGSEQRTFRLVKK